MFKPCEAEWLVGAEMWPVESLVLRVLCIFHLGPVTLHKSRRWLQGRPVALPAAPQPCSPPLPPPPPCTRTACVKMRPASQEVSEASHETGTTAGFDDLLDGVC